MEHTYIDVLKSRQQDIREHQYATALSEVYRLCGPHDLQTVYNMMYSAFGNKIYNGASENYNIESYAFADLELKGTKDIVIKNATLNYRAFSGSDIQKITLSECLPTSYAFSTQIFYKCKNLVSATVSFICDGMFSHCNSLQDVILIPNDQINYHYLASESLAYCVNLETLVLPKTITSASTNALKGVPMDCKITCGKAFANKLQAKGFSNIVII